MSVINQVLVELEKRRASVAERATLPDHVRALPEGGGADNARWIAVGGTAGLALLCVGWFTLSGIGFPRQTPVAAAPLPATEAVIEKVVAASAAVGTDRTPRAAAGSGEAGAWRPAARLSLELSSAPAVPQPAEPQPATAGARGPIPAARVLGRPMDEPGPGPARDTAADTVSMPSSNAGTAVAKKAATTVAVAVEKAPPATSGKVQIEKEVRQPTARDLADNEYRKGANALHQGRLVEAQEGFRAALGLYPAHHGARQALVALLVESKAFAESERTLQEGIKLAPEQIGFATTLARLQVNRGDNAAAVATLQNAVSHAHGSADFVAFLAALLQRQSRHEEAVEQFQAALRMKPNTGVWWLGLAMSLQALNRTPDAQEAYRRAKSTNNLNPELNAFAEQRLRQLQ